MKIANYLLVIALVFTCCNTNAQQPNLIDTKATAETKNLWHNLHQLAGKQILFGHQHATEYGHGWIGEPDMSDVKKVTGSHPALIGIDLSGFTGINDSQYAKTKNDVIKTASETYNRGGVVTISWHAHNPVDGGGFYYKDSTTPKAVPQIIPGGSHHEQYKAMLKQVADFALQTKGIDGKLVPMIFRPFHEYDGDWFWWGAGHCTRDEFVQLWRFTVRYLRDSLQVHNFIYAFSPDCKFDSKATFLERFPGADWVDMIGMDNYADFGRDGKYNVEGGIKKLYIIQSVADSLHKLSAFTETGLESIPNNTWWTETLLKTVMQPGLTLSYVLVWRNDSKSATHYYAPFPGHSSVPDFMKFYQHPFTLFEKDLPDIYKPVLKKK
jgi:mannan endo-1,4-beta-mannosidase